MSIEPYITQNKTVKDDDATRAERKDQFANDSLEGLLQEMICDHTPDLLNLIDTIYEDGLIISRLNCQCGELIDEIYSYTDNEVFKY